MQGALPLPYLGIYRRWVIDIYERHGGKAFPCPVPFRLKFPFL